MSGHSKWSKIRHAKGAADAKKGKIFSKLAQQISVATKEGGGDIDANPTLRKLVDKAKSDAMPANNIQRAINKGLGVGQNGASFEEYVYEGIAQGGFSIIVDVVTDNKNRVVSELRNIFSDGGGVLSDSGSVSWNFVQKGRIEVQCGKMVDSKKHGEGQDFVKSDYEEFLANILEISGVVDLNELDEITVEIITEVQDLHKVKDEVKNLEYVISTYELIRIPKTFREISEEEAGKLNPLLESLEEYPDVQSVWTDANL